MGQRTFQIALEKAPAGTLAAIVIRHKKSAETLKYTVGDSWLPRLTEWNRTLDPRGRYEAVMKAEGLFDVTEMK